MTPGALPVRSSPRRCGRHCRCAPPTSRASSIVPDGPRKLGKWDPTLTPYVIEPLDMTSTDSSVNSFCVMKSAQTGFSTMLLAAVAHTIVHDKADTMIVQPTDGSLSEFN